MKRRIAVALLAAAALGLSSYLALYQLRIIGGVWDPAGGSLRVLDWAGIPDAALGAVAYAVEIILALVARSRWPLIVYGLWSASLAFAGAVLVAVQMFVIHAICVLCCCSAALSMVIFAIAASEVIPAVTRRDRDR